MKTLSIIAVLFVCTHAVAQETPKPVDPANEVKEVLKEGDVRASPAEEHPVLVALGFCALIIALILCIVLLMRSHQLGINEQLTASIRVNLQVIETLLRTTPEAAGAVTFDLEDVRTTLAQQTNMYSRQTEDVLSELSAKVSRAAEAVKRTITQVNIAKLHGPRLFQELPGMLERRQTEIAQCTNPEKARRAQDLLNDARRKFDESGSPPDTDSGADWLPFYIIYESVQSSSFEAGEVLNDSADDADGDSVDSGDDGGGGDGGGGD